MEYVDSRVGGNPRLLSRKVRAEGWWLFRGMWGWWGELHSARYTNTRTVREIPSGLDVCEYIFLVDRHIFSIVRPTGTGLAASHPEQTPGHADGQQSFSDNLGSLPALDTSNSPGPQ